MLCEAEIDRNWDIHFDKAKVHTLVLCVGMQYIRICTYLYMQYLYRDTYSICKGIKHEELACMAEMCSVCSFFLPWYTLDKIRLIKPASWMCFQYCCCKQSSQCFITYITFITDCLFCILFGKPDVYGLLGSVSTSATCHATLDT